jgi:glutamate-ammonia-ligase adenylyltransferase
MIISALSSITRTGHLYHVDLRLRPDGNDGPLVTGSQGFLDYLQQRAAVWEWLAYVKLRAVAGDLELGRSIEIAAREIIHGAASRISHEDLQREIRRVRDRLEQETVKPGRRAGLDIKHGKGGMLDIYFATRYLQLRDNIPDEAQSRSTLATLTCLKAAGSLSTEDYEVLSRGYSLLRAVDHEQRLMKGRSAWLPPADHPVVRDIARKLNYNSSADFSAALVERMERIRAAYNRITQ